jgi:hypothetical protein
MSFCQSAVAAPPALTAYRRPCGTTTIERVKVRPSASVPRRFAGPGFATVEESQVTAIRADCEPVFTFTVVGRVLVSPSQT